MSAETNSGKFMRLFRRSFLVNLLNLFLLRKILGPRSIYFRNKILSVKKNAFLVFVGEWGWPVVGYVPMDDVPITERVERLKKKHGKIFS